MKRNRQSLLILVLTALIAVSTIAFCPPAEAATKAKKIVLSQKTITVPLNSAYQLWVAKVTPASLMPAVPEKAKWKTSNKKIAKVDANGLVTAVKKGSCTITCTYLGAKATCKVKVVLVPLTGYQLDKPTLKLEPGKTATVTPVKFEPENTTSKKAATWRTSNAAVAKVSDAGVISALTPGSASIICKIDGIERTCALTVPEIALTGYALDKTSLVLDERGKDASKTATLTPTKFTPDNTTSKKVASWKSSNTAIAKVSDAGVVTAVALGNCAITCAIDGIERTCSVQVGSTERQYIYEVCRLVNVERKKAGLTELTVNEKMMGYAWTRSRELEKRYDHLRPDGTACLTIIPNYRTVYCGENIAMGRNNGVSTPALVMTAWMNSQGHRESILDPKFRVIGVGYYKVGTVQYWVQLFAAAAP